MPQFSRRIFLSTPAFLAMRLSAAAWKSRELRRYPAPEANQAVAVDAGHFYAIGNHVIAKYEKKSGKRVAGWECEKAKPLIHLNSGFVQNEILYCAHSNYPSIPMVSSIEMWDAGSLRHKASHSFGVYEGSATWVENRMGRWHVTFGHYGGKQAQPNRDARWTSLIEFDNEWRRLRAWVYPAALIAKLGDYTISGGTFGPDGLLYCTGHDNQEVYVLSLPSGGSELVLEGSFASPNHGQGIAWDPAEPWTMYSIDRAKREVIVTAVERA